MAEQIEKVISVRVDGIEKALASFEAIEAETKLIKNYLQETGRSLPEKQIKALAKSFVEARAAAAQMKNELDKAGDQIDRNNSKAKGLGRSLKDAFKNIGSDALGGGGVSGLMGGLLGGGLFSLIDKGVTALLDWAFAAEEASAASESLASNTESLTQGYAEEKVQLDSLFAPLFDVNLGTEERSRLIDEIESKYGDYIGDIDLERATQEQLAEAYRNVNDAIIDNLIQKTKAKNLEKQFDLIAQKQIQIEKERQRLLNIDFAGAPLDKQTELRFQAIENSTVIKQLTKDIDDLTRSFNDNARVIDAAGQALKGIGLDFGSVNVGGTGGTGGNGGSSAGAKSTVKALIFDIENLTQAITAAERAIGTNAANEELEILIKIIEAKRDAAIADNAAALASQNLSGRTKEELEEEIALQNRLSLEYSAQVKEIAELRLEQQKNFLATTGEIKTISDLTKGSDFRDSFNRPIQEQKKIIEELVRSSKTAWEFITGLSEKGIYLVGTEDIIDKSTQATRTIKALQDELKALNELQTKGIVTEAEIRAKAAKAINDLGDELSKRREESDKVITTFILEEPEKLAAILEEAGVTSFEIVRRNLLDQATSVLETSLNVIRQSIEELRKAFPGESIFAGSPDEGGLTLLPDFAKKFPVEAERIKTLMTTWNTEITLLFDTHRKRLEGIDTEAWDTIVKNASKASKDQIRQLKADQKSYEIEFEELYRRLYKLDKEHADGKRKANEDFNQEDIDEVKRHIQQLIDIKNAETAAELEAEVDKYIKLIELQKGNADKQIILLKELENKRKEIVNANQKTNEEVIERFSELLDSETKKVREGFSHYFSGLQSAISTTNEAIDNMFQFLLNEQQFVIDDLIAELTKIEELVQDTQSRINELEDDLEGKRSGRREAILRAIESEKDAEERLLERKLELQAKLLKEEEKMAKKRKAFAISQALINGALASMNIWANNTIPYPAALAFNIPMQVAIAALTATQVALIAQQKFAKGGHTGSGRGGDRDETGHIPVGVVHNDEYVVPKWMVKSPKYRPIIDNLESARKRGFAEGGYTSPDFAALSDSVSPNSTNRVYSLVQRSVDAAIALSERPVIANPVEFTNVERTVARRVQATTIGG